MLYDGEHDTIAAHQGLLERTILLDGFSKTFAMTGWRLGYAALPRELVEPITRLIINSVSCTAPAVQLAGVAALTGPRDEVDAMLAEFRRRRDAIVAGLNELPGVSCVMPRGAFYAFPNITGTGLDARSSPIGCSRRPASPCSPAPPSAPTARATSASRTPTRSRTSRRRSPRWARCSRRAAARPGRCHAPDPRAGARAARGRDRALGLAGRRAAAADELHAAIAGADAIVTLLHDRVDDAFLDAAGRSSGRRERRGRLRQHRRSGLRRAAA